MYLREREVGSQEVLPLMSKGVNALVLAEGKGVRPLMCATQCQYQTRGDLPLHFLWQPPVLAALLGSNHQQQHVTHVM